MFWARGERVGIARLSGSKRPKTAPNEPFKKIFAIFWFPESFLLKTSIKIEKWGYRGIFPVPKAFPAAPSISDLRRTPPLQKITLKIFEFFFQKLFLKTALKSEIYGI